MGWFTKPIFIVLVRGVCHRVPHRVGRKPIHFRFLGPGVRRFSALGLTLNTPGMDILIVLKFFAWLVLREPRHLSKWEFRRSEPIPRRRTK